MTTYQVFPTRTAAEGAIVPDTVRAIAVVTGGKVINGGNEMTKGNYLAVYMPDSFGTSASDVALTTNNGEKLWSPAAEVTPQHWGATANGSEDNPQDDRQYIFDADKWAAAQGLPLVGHGQYAIGSKLDLRSESVELSVKLLPLLIMNNESQSVEPKENYALSVGSFTNAGDSHRYRFVIDGGNIHGKICKGWDPNSGKFPVEYWTRKDMAGIVKASEIQADQWYTIMNVRDTDFNAINAKPDTPVVNARGVLFKANGPGTGKGDAIQREVVETKAGDVFIVTADGTLNGQSFTVGDRLKALGGTLSENVFQGSWEKADSLFALRIRGIARPLNNIDVQGINCDVLAHVLGNSERLNVSASGEMCGCVLWESDETVSNDRLTTPDSNTFFIRGASCAQWYKADGALVSNVELNTQNSLETSFDVPCVEDRGRRMRQFSGIMRTNHSPILLTGVDVTKTNGEIDRFKSSYMFDLCLEGAMRSNNQIDGGNEPVLQIEQAQNLSGNLLMRIPVNGVRFDDIAGSDLSVTFEDATQGAAVVLGNAQNGTEFRGTLNLSISDVGTGAQAIDAQVASNTVVNYTGALLPVKHLSGIGTQYNLPAAMVTSKVGVELGNGSPVVTFRGTAPQADFDSYQHSVVGMHGTISEGGRPRVWYDGSNWLRTAGIVVAEADWTPTVAIGSDTPTLENAQGRYIKTGNHVFCTGRFTLKNIGTSTGRVEITNLPFVPVAMTVPGTGSCAFAAGTSAAAGENISVMLVQKSEMDPYVARFTIWNENGRTNNLSSNEVANGTRLRFCFSYISSE